MSYIPSKKLLTTKLKKIGIIDIGSNAIRFSAAHYKKQDFYEILHRTRVPLRLGDSVFRTGLIPNSKIQLSTYFFEQFQEIAELYKIQRIEAIATSAVRDSKNQNRFVHEIHKKTGIEIKPITGFQEASLIHLAISTHIKRKTPYIIFDLGGGSLECIIVDEKHRIINSKSFNFGTVRMLEVLNLQGRRLAKTYMDYHLESLNHFIRDHLTSKKFDIYGTGGNLRRMGKLRRSVLKKRSIQEISLEETSLIKKELSRYNNLDRAARYKLKIDRSEVIIPSLMIFEYILKKLKSPRVYLPDLALTDGLIINAIDEHEII